MRGKGVRVTVQSSGHTKQCIHPVPNPGGSKSTPTILPKSEGPGSVKHFCSPLKTGEPMKQLSRLHYEDNRLKEDTQGSTFQSMTTYPVKCLLFWIPGLPQ